VDDIPQIVFCHIGGILTEGKKRREWRRHTGLSRSVRAATSFQEFTRAFNYFALKTIIFLT